MITLAACPIFLLLTCTVCSALSFPSPSRINSDKGSYRYVAFYKPALTLCTLRDDAARAERKQREARSTLKEFNLPKGLHIVGRLDRDSEGLLLLTDDGQFTAAVAEPSDDNQANATTCQKTYWALVRGRPDESALLRMRKGGLNIRGSITRPPVAARILLFDAARQLPTPALGMDRAGSWIEIILSEGRNRQVRRITADAGHHCIRLVRISIGSLTLGILQPGEWRYINKNEVLADFGES